MRKPHYLLPTLDVDVKSLLGDPFWLPSFTQFASFVFPNLARMEYLLCGRHTVGLLVVLSGPSTLLWRGGRVSLNVLPTLSIPGSAVFHSGTRCFA